MIITENVRVSRLFKITWKTDLLILISCVISYLADKYVLLRLFELPALIPTVIGTALAFFIGFNNNQAYDRWWEARKIWGSLVNNSRSWARGVLAYSGSEYAEQDEVRRLHSLLIYRHIAFLYVLNAALRNRHWQSYKKYLSEEEVAYVETQSNKHNAILLLQSQTLNWMLDNNWIDQFKFLYLNELLVTFTDDMGKSERIKNTVFPTTYHSFTRVIIWLFSVLITIVTAETTGPWSVGLGFIVSFVFQVTFMIGHSLLNPFEAEISGIPIDSITRTIEINLLEMLGESDIPKPVQAVNGEYIM